VQPNLTRPT